MNAHGRIEARARSRLLLATPAVLLVAMVGVSLLTADPQDGERTASPSAQTTARASPTPPARATPSPSPTTAGLDECPELAAGSHDIAGLGPIRVTISLPAGWFHCPLPWLWSAADGGGEIGIALGDGGPCARRRAPAVSDAERDRSTVTVDGYSGERIEFRPLFGLTCHPNRVLDLLGDPGPRGPIALTLWVLDVAGAPLTMYAEFSPPDRARQEELRRLVESARISVDPNPQASPDEIAVVRPAGALVPGPYWAAVDSRPAGRCCPNGFPFSFMVPSRDWSSAGLGGLGGSISRGAVGAPGAAVIRFSNPDGVYADPCAHTPGPRAGKSVADLVAAVSTIPGVDMAGPVDVALRSSTASQVTLTLRDDIGCGPGSFYLWYDEDEGPRPATAAGSTIRLLIFNPNDRPEFGRIVVEVETYPGTGRELEREIQTIIASIGHGG